MLKKKNGFVVFLRPLWNYIIFWQYSLEPHFILIYAPLLGVMNRAVFPEQYISYNIYIVMPMQVTGVQTLSGTGALRVAADTLSGVLKYNTFYFSSPTWGEGCMPQLLFGPSQIFMNSKSEHIWILKSAWLTVLAIVKHFTNIHDIQFCFTHISELESLDWPLELSVWLVLSATLVI